MAKKNVIKTGKSLPAKKAIALPSALEIQRYVHSDMFTPSEWEQLVEYIGTKDAWQIGFEAFQKVAKKFKIPKRKVTPEIQKYFITRLTETVIHFKTVDYLKQQVKTTIVLMFSALKTINRVK